MAQEGRASGIHGITKKRRTRTRSRTQVTIALQLSDLIVDHLVTTITPVDNAFLSMDYVSVLFTAHQYQPPKSRTAFQAFLHFTLHPLFSIHPPSYCRQTKRVTLICDHLIASLTLPGFTSKTIRNYLDVHYDEHVVGSSAASRNARAAIWVSK